MRLFALWLIPLFVVSCGARSSRQPDQPEGRFVCTDAASQVERVWSADVRRHVQDAILAVEGVGTRASADLVITRLDANVKSWSLAHTRNCSGLPEEPAARLARARINRCLADAWISYGALIDALTAADVEVLIHVQDALAHVSEKTALCGREPVYAFYAAPEASQNPAKAEAVARELARAEVLGRLKRKADVERACRYATDAAPETGDVRLLVVAMIAEGTKLKADRRYAPALQQAQEALGKAKAPDLSDTLE